MKSSISFMKISWPISWLFQDDLRDLLLLILAQQFHDFLSDFYFAYEIQSAAEKVLSLVHKYVSSLTSWDLNIQISSISEEWTISISSLIWASDIPTWEALRILFGQSQINTLGRKYEMMAIVRCASSNSFTTNRLETKCGQVPEISDIIWIQETKRAMNRECTVCIC